MKILQELPRSCSCPECDAGCQCGDCSVCSNLALDGAISRYAKTLALAAFLLLVLGGFVFFVPVVAIGATPPVTQTVSLRVQTVDSAVRPLGSIGYCYLGVGAVLVQGVYYPSVALNQSSSRDWS